VHSAPRRHGKINLSLAREREGALPGSAGSHLQSISEDLPGQEEWMTKSRMDRFLSADMALSSAAADSVQ
jgi:hypothetical protein